MKLTVRNGYIGYNGYGYKWLNINPKRATFALTLSIQDSQTTNVNPTRGEFPKSTLTVTGQENTRTPWVSIILPNPSYLGLGPSRESARYWISDVRYQISDMSSAQRQVRTSPLGRPCRNA